MAYRVQVITSWVSTAERNSWRLEIDHPPPPGVSYSDITEQPDENIPPTPNLVIVEIELADDALLAELDADPNVIILHKETM